MENMQNEKTNQNINYNVYNALNLYCEDLGQAYLQNGFNPFDDNFVLDENYVADVLANQNIKKEVASPEFLEQSENDIAKSFDLSLENATLLLDALNKKCNTAETEQQKKALKKIILTLMLYIELIKTYKAKLKKEKNKYQLYVNLLSLNWFLSEEMSNSFTAEFNMQQVLNKIDTLENDIVQKENEDLKKQAKQIIENNQKIYAEQETKATAQKEPTNKFQEALKQVQSKNTSIKSVSPINKPANSANEDLER